MKAGYAFCDNLATLLLDTTRTMRLLLVEDDRMIGDSLRGALRLEGYAVDWVRDAGAANGTLASERFDLVLLDLGLPASAAPNAEVQPAGGLEVLRALRARQDATPCIVLTARDGPGDKVAGLDAGADDYLVKPFDFGELLARLRALLRRGPVERPAIVAIGDLRIDAETRVVTRDGQEIELTGREYDVLEFLARRAGRVVSRSELLDAIWSDYEGSPNIIDVYVGYLRKKLGRALIRTVRGSGFVLEPW